MSHKQKTSYRAGLLVCLSKWRFFRFADDFGDFGRDGGEKSDLLTIFDSGDVGSKKPQLRYLRRCSQGTHVFQLLKG